MDITTVYIITIIFTATFIRSTFGFGEALIAVPLLAFFMPIEEAVPLSVLLSIIISVMVLIQDRRKVAFKSVIGLILSALAGIPFGLGILIYVNEQVIKLVLGILLIIYSLFSLKSKKQVYLNQNNKKWLVSCGFISGVLGGAYGFNGPPLVIYGKISNWSNEHFRATLQAYFLPVSSISMVAYSYKGLWTSNVDHNLLVAAPVVIPAVLIGRYCNRRINNKSFLNYIFIGLAVIGVLLLYQTITF